MARFIGVRAQASYGRIRGIDHGSLYRGSVDVDKGDGDEPVADYFGELVTAQFEFDLTEDRGWLS